MPEKDPLFEIVAVLLIVPCEGLVDTDNEPSGDRVTDWVPMDALSEGDRERKSVAVLGG